MTGPSSFNLTQLSDALRTLNPEADYQLMFSNERLCAVAKHWLNLPESGVPMHNANYWIWHADYVFTVNKWAILCVVKAKINAEELRAHLHASGFQKVALFPHLLEEPKMSDYLEGIFPRT